MTETAIVWFRRDLRLDDNAALSAAAESGVALGTDYPLPVTDLEASYDRLP